MSQVPYQSGFCMNDFFWRVVQGCFLESTPKKQRHAFVEDTQNQLVYV